MHFEFLANLTFIAHGLFVLLVIPSTYLLATGVYRNWPTLALAHYASIAVMVAGQIRFKQCPLVTLEEALRNKAGTEMWYEGGYVRFVTHELTGIWLPLGFVGMVTALIALVSVAAVFRYAGSSDRRVQTA